MADILPLTSIRTDGNTQARESLSEAVIGEYAEALTRGDQFPLIDVYFDGDAYWLADRFHRVKAAAQVGQDTIAAIVHEGGQREALLHAVGANDTHGLRRSNADKRKAVLTLLADEEWRQWNDHEVARRTKTSHPFVTKLRREYLETFPDSTATRKVKRGGTTYTMDTARIGTTQAPRPAKVITMPTNRPRETPEARAGAPPPAAPSPSAVVPPREVIAPPVSPSVESPTVVAPQPAQQEEPMAIPLAPVLVRAWEQASEEERQEFVTQYRTVLLELLAVQERQEEPAHAVPPDVHPDTQPGLILIVLRTATAPLSLEDLAQTPGITRRVLGRNLTRLCDTGRVEKTADGRYALQAVSQ
jgi:hypothetical protein